LPFSEGEIVENIDILESELNILYSHLAAVRCFQVQSLEEHEVTGFKDEDEGDNSGFIGNTDNVMTDIDTGDFLLANFLERPVRIQSFTIPQNEAYSIRTFQPWFDFLDATAIKKKLDNYAYIQGDLHLKVVVNSTPFIYGNYGMSYRPLTGFGSQHDYSATTNPLYANIFTQRPTIYIESHKNKGGELTLPFFYHRTWLPLTASAVTGMGEINLYQLAPFQAANPTATSDVTVVVYAWMSNVKLAGNTVDLAVQALKEDEVRPASGTSAKSDWSSKPISKAASVVAGVARSLTAVPGIGLYAMATEMGATLIGTAASLFGWSNPPVIDNVAPLKNLPFHAFSTSEISVPFDKLTLDPKNELTVDPSIAGLPSTDELAISYIAQRPALIRTQDWLTTDIEDTSLFKFNVTPTACRDIGVAPSKSYIDTPVGYISRLFSNWRGDLIVRIVLVKSQYHQGRLRVTYDPQGDIYSDAVSETVANTKIIDISTTDYLEFRIPYMAPQSWLRVDPDINTANSGKGGGPGTYDSDYHNGRFEIRVLNTLSSPDATKGVKLLYMIRAAENFELANPSDFRTDTSIFEVQSKDEDEFECYEMGVCTTRPDDLLKVNFGEDIRSLRSVMRRMTRHTMVGRQAPNTAPGPIQILSLNELNIYPVCYGYQSSSPYDLVEIVGVGNAPGQWANETPFTYLSMLFVGQRGSMNYAFNNVTSSNIQSINVQRNNEPMTTRLFRFYFNIYRCWSMEK
jgi:hypothetical protein